MTPLPPKQGLKQIDNNKDAPILDVMTPLPPKQGLKRGKKSVSLHASVGYDTTSTKTRIETGDVNTWLVSADVMTPLPPKQGLKLHKLTPEATHPSGYDTTSTKTRIETAV